MPIFSRPGQRVTINPHLAPPSFIQKVQKIDSFKLEITLFSLIVGKKVGIFTAPLLPKAGCGSVAGSFVITLLKRDGLEYSLIWPSIQKMN